MMNYKRYYESLKRTPEPSDESNVGIIDYKGLVKHAASKGLEPCDLPDNEKNMFIISTLIGSVLHRGS